jgi:hypothetical protein
LQHHGQWGDAPEIWRQFGKRAMKLRADALLKSSTACGNGRIDRQVGAWQSPKLKPSPKALPPQLIF